MNPQPTESKIRRAVDRRGLLDFATAALACALISAALLGQAALRTRITQDGYRLKQLSDESAKLSREHEALQIRAAQLQSPQRIEELARTRLSMGPAPIDRVVVLVGDSVRPAPLALGR